MSDNSKYTFEYSNLFGTYHTVILLNNNRFGMNFTIKHPTDFSNETALVGYMINNPYSKEYYAEHNIEPEYKSASVENLSASCYIVLSDEVYNSIEDIMIRVYEELCRGFAQYRFGNHLNIEVFFEM